MVYLPTHHMMVTDKQGPETSPKQIIFLMISHSQQYQIQATHKKFSVQHSLCLALKIRSLMARRLRFHLLHLSKDHISTYSCTWGHNSYANTTITAFPAGSTIAATLLETLLQLHKIIYLIKSSSSSLLGLSCLG